MQVHHHCIMQMESKSCDVPVVVPLTMVLFIIHDILINTKIPVVKSVVDNYYDMLAGMLSRVELMSMAQ